MSKPDSWADAGRTLASSMVHALQDGHGVRDKTENLGRIGASGSGTHPLPAATSATLRSGMSFGMDGCRR
jgi:hypothetical protein